MSTPQLAVVVHRLFAVVFVSFAVCPPASAQVTSSGIEGTIGDGAHARIAGASVEVQSRETGAMRRTAADASGVFRVLGLAPGSYDITVRAIGYRAERRSGLELVLGETERVRFQLIQTTGPLELEPVVVLAGSASDVTRTQVSTAVLEKEIERLPTNSRDALGLAAIAPGVRSFGTRASAAAGALASARFVNLYLDGAELKGMSTGQLVGMPNVGSLFPQEAIREFLVALNPYDAEYSHGGSWVMSAITHQGSNDVHGSLFFYGQNRDLVARGTRELTKPEYRREQMGGNVRGPIVRDHVYYSLSYEGQLTDNYLNVVPGRPAYAPSLWDRYAGTFRAPLRNQLGLARLTGVLGSHTLDAIWSGRRLTNQANFGTQVNGIMQSHDAAISSSYGLVNAQLRDRYVSHSLVNELSVGLLDSHDLDAPLVPGTTMQYPGIQVGRVTFPQEARQRFATLADHSSWTARGIGGEHGVKFGVELRSFEGHGFQPIAADGLFAFKLDTSTMPQSAQIGVGFDDPSTTNGARGSIYGWTAAAYAQDECRPTSSFSLTFGVRYDADINTLNQGKENPWSRDTALQRVLGPRYLDSRHRHNDLDNLAPRIAASWDVGGAGRTSLRAGYGIMYDRIPVFGPFQEATSWSWRVYLFTSPGTTDPEELRRRVATNQGTPVRPQLQLLPDRMETPENRQWSVGMGHRVGDHLVLQLDYVDQHMVHLPVTIRTNAGTHVLTDRYGAMTLWGSFGDARYRGLLTSLVYDHGSTRISGAYTLGWAESEFNGVSTSEYPDSASYAMQWSNGDERHRAVLSALTELPFGLQLSTITVFASPHPFGVIVGTDVNGSGVNTDDWPDGIRTSRARWWDAWFRTVDVRIGKSVGASRRRVVATLDVFNLFNWANHSDYRQSQSQSDYRQPIGDFARRQAQVGLRYQF